MIILNRFGATSLHPSKLLVNSVTSIKFLLTADPYIIQEGRYRESKSASRFTCFGFHASILAAEPRFASRRGEWGGEKCLIRPILLAGFADSQIAVSPPRYRHETPSKLACLQAMRIKDLDLPISIIRKCMVTSKEILYFGNGA